MLHKLLANFEYEPNDISENDKGYFRFEAKPLVTDDGLSLEITLDVPLQNSLLTSAETAEAERAALYRSQFDALNASLKSYQLAKEAGDFKVNEDTRKIILTPKGLNKLCDKDGKPRGLISGTMNIYRELRACYCGDEIETNIELKLIRENKSQLLSLVHESDNYFINNIREVDLKNGKSKDFNRSMVNELKNALINLISRKLKVLKDQIALNCQGNDYDFSIKLNKLDYEKLMELNPNNSSRTTKFSREELSPPREAVQADNINFETAKKILDDNIFKLLIKPGYADKEPLIIKVKESFKRLDDLDAVCGLYDYITAPERKEFLNIHKNPIYDSIFRKPNTTSWQELVHEIRDHAFFLLMKKVGLEGTRVEDIINDKDSHIQTATINFGDLDKYKIRAVFREPRANSFILSLFRTNTVKAIEKLFDNSVIASQSRLLAPM